MVVSRGISTPIDVGLALLLVSASVLVIGSIDPPTDSGPDIQGTTHLGSSMTVSYDGPAGKASVTGTMGGLLADAAIVANDPNASGGTAFVRAVTQAVDRHIERRGIPVQVVATCTRPEDGTELVSVVAGRDPPSDGTVRTTTYHRVPRGPSNRTAEASACEPIIIVRRWST